MSCVCNYLWPTQTGMNNLKRNISFLNTDFGRAKLRTTSTLCGCLPRLCHFALNTLHQCLTSFNFRLLECGTAMTRTVASVLLEEPGTTPPLLLPQSDQQSGDWERWRMLKYCDSYSFTNTFTLITLNTMFCISSRSCWSELFDISEFALEVQRWCRLLTLTRPTTCLLTRWEKIFSWIKIYFSKTSINAMKFQFSSVFPILQDWTRKDSLTPRSYIAGVLIVAFLHLLQQKSKVNSATPCSYNGVTARYWFHSLLATGDEFGPIRPPSWIIVTYRVQLFFSHTTFLLSKFSICKIRSAEKKCKTI